VSGAALANLLVGAMILGKIAGASAVTAITGGGGGGRGMHGERCV
jgi:hypothetical protein